MKALTVLASGCLIASVACSADPNTGAGTTSTGGVIASGGAPGSGSGASGTGGAGGTISWDASRGDVGAKGGGSGGDHDAAGATDAKREREMPLGPCHYADWSQATTYAPGDIVMYLGQAYVAVAHSTGRIPPINPLSWAPYDGCEPPPPPGCNYPQWRPMLGENDPGYNAGDIVLHWSFAWKPRAFIAVANGGEDPGFPEFPYWQPFSACQPPPPPPFAPCALLDKLLPNGEGDFRQMFTPDRHTDPLDAFSYASFCKALATPGFEGFVRSAVDLQNKRELAAFFALVSEQTDYLNYTGAISTEPTDLDYHGRGALLVSGRADYTALGKFLGVDLLNNNQQLVDKDPAAWQSGIWLWMLHAPPADAGTGAATCHDAIAQGDFGRTVRIVMKDCKRADVIVAQYKTNCMLLGVDPGNTTCQ